MRQRVARLVKEDADKKAAAAAEVVDDGILQQIDAEEAAEIEFERTTMPEDAIIEPYIKVEDVAENVLLTNLILKDASIWASATPV